MNVLTVVSDLLAFALEMAALAGYALLGSRLSSRTVWRVLGGVVCLALVITLWALFFSPKATYRLAMPWLLFGKAVIFLAPACGPWRIRQPIWMGVWITAVIVHLALAVWLKRL